MSYLHLQTEIKPRAGRVNTREKLKPRGGTYGIIYVRPSIGGQSLENFAKHIFAWFEISQFDEDFVGRDYEERSFIGSALGITVRIQENGSKNLEKYSFCISFSLQGTKQAAEYLAQHAHMIAWRLSHEGFRCFVPKDIITVRSEQDGMVYDA